MRRGIFLTEHRAGRRRSREAGPPGSLQQSPLNDREICPRVRFVQLPGGREHLAEHKLHLAPGRRGHGQQSRQDEEEKSPSGGMCEASPAHAGPTNPSTCNRESRGVRSWSKEEKCMGAHDSGGHPRFKRSCRRSLRRVAPLARRGRETKRRKTRDASHCSTLDLA